MAVFNREDVNQYVWLSAQLTEAAATYAGEPFSDASMNGMLSQLQVATSSLQVALATTALRAAQRQFNPPPPETDSEAEPVHARVVKRR